MQTTQLNVFDHVLDVPTLVYYYIFYFYIDQNQ